MSEKTEKISSGKIQNCLEFCSDKDNCLSLNEMLRSFNAPLSEEQAWSLIYQSVLLYRNFIHIEFIDKHTKKEAKRKSSHRIKVPKSTRNLNVHKDGSVHISDSGELKARANPFHYLLLMFPRLESNCWWKYLIIVARRPDLLTKLTRVGLKMCNSCLCLKLEEMRVEDSRRFVVSWSIFHYVLVSWTSNEKEDETTKLSQ